MQTDDTQNQGKSVNMLRKLIFDNLMDKLAFMLMVAQQASANAEDAKLNAQLDQAKNDIEKLKQEYYHRAEMTESEIRSVTETVKTIADSLNDLNTNALH